VAQNLRVISIGSVMPQNGGKTQGGVATIHSTITSLFINHPEFEIKIIGSIATNSDFDSDPINNIPYFKKLDNEKNHEMLDRLIEHYKPDILFIHHISHSWASSISKVSKLPICVGYVHSWNPVDPNNNKNFENKKTHLSQGISFFDHLIFNSPHSFQRGISMGFEYPNDTHIIPPPVSELFINAGLPNPSDSIKKIVFIGSLNENKNVQKLIDSIEQLSSDYRLTIIGNGNLEIHPSPKITHYASLSHTEIVNVLQDSSVLCVPSRCESFGLVYTEALCCGVPVIGFEPSINYIAELMAINCGIGLLNPNIGELTKSIESLTSQNIDRITLQSRAKEMFSLQNYAKNLSTFFRQITP
jgi:glycosyltransferase involved in cell wall biosynthesis